MGQYESVSALEEKKNGLACFLGSVYSIYLCCFTVAKEAPVSVGLNCFHADELALSMLHHKTGVYRVFPISFEASKSPRNDTVVNSLDII